ncbi:phenylalanine 4-monooxygenase [Photobacterium sp. DNB23_23_1]|uniref:Phenylalanine-4-hydroxylase n=1 Tax=Photobacterium pectinilyticum TaxID=2906793 RepID=A0ABT1N3A4_9GAMM|nr:phenylalanine 4-monooxygenase [Photobacterium sp. ZSDE20]MCQ1059226.1 phenylalanine 4-monooxygenase [Photobacterium sp. ZSDE20]MDD1824541.1 phenylalanine 4-monooxygenase [Photobacterium sp. ZSDE20]
MGSGTKYVSNKPDEKGVVHWDCSEDLVWHDLIQRQLACIEGRACQAYIDGLELLDLPQERPPQLSDINEVLQSTTGWKCVAVPALINFDRFFALLANKQFPVATFLRRREEFDYLQEPDFFHEIFGHCAMLTNPAFAAFTHTYGNLGAKANSAQRVYLARLYWFTVEFGLLEQLDGLRIYGGGILSSPGETQYSLTGKRVSGASSASDQGVAIDETRPLYKSFDPVDIMRTPYRIDIMQPLYFILEDINKLYELAHQDIMSMVAQAQKLGLHAPLFDTKIKEVS